MISNHIQPDSISISENLQLIKYYPYYKRTLAWYSDPAICRQADNICHTYDLPKLKAMYNYLCRNGECYYIKYKDNGKWRLIGDISLYNGEIAIVIDKQWQNRHLGRQCVRALLERAKHIGLRQIRATIYPFNVQSQKMFLSVGFTKITGDTYLYEF